MASVADTALNHHSFTHSRQLDRFNRREGMELKRSIKFDVRHVSNGTKPEMGRSYDKWICSVSIVSVWVTSRGAGI